MPVRINLLAEDQALEEERRRDPVKRACWVAGFVVALALVWSAVLQLKIVSSRSVLTGLEAQWQAMEKNYQQAVESQRNVIEAEQKLGALQQLATNRFLWGTALNALQQSMAGVEDIQLIRLKGDQAYVLSEEIKARTNNGVIIPGKPATSTERISMLLDAMDASRQPGSQVNRFKQSIALVSYFQNTLQKTNGVLLTSLSAPQLAPDSRQPFVTFSLQCYFPEKVR